MRTGRFFIGIVLLVSMAGTVQMQTPTPSPKPSECDVPALKEIDRKPKILAKPDPVFEKQERKKYRGKAITLRATLCGSGKVTDIVVTNGITATMDAAAVEAAKLIQFEAAEKDGKKVSRLLILKYFVR
ncbi:MAG TPA: hypothetical protein VJT71_13470 [Pyrinomonadaceae bacterium]|nr:hypothetical protein [Pyrinomonadaceae bacterium]